MNVTCHVTQRTTNRICLSVPGSAAEPELGQFMAQFVLRLPGVAGVEIWPGSESVVILHDGGRPAAEAILDALRGKQLSAPNTKQAIQPAAVTEPAAAAAVRPPLARYEVLHAMRGRVRLHIPVLKAEKGLSGALAHHLGMQPGVKTVRVNRLAADVIVTFDPALTSANVLVAEVAGYNPDPSEIEHWRTVEDSAELDPGQRNSRQKLEMAMVFGALALSVVFGAAAGFVAQLLFWGSVASMVHRTYRFALKDRRATLDAAAAAMMAFLLLTGMAWQAALIPIAFVALPWLRSKLAAQQAKPVTAQDGAEQDDVVIFIPSEQDGVKRYGKSAVEPHTASSGAAAGTSHNALRSSIVGGLAVWVASKSVQRAAKRATLKAEKAAR